jgi:hypothetical protein
LKVTLGSRTTPKIPVESYIVRVYHRDEQDPALVDGVVEIVVTGEKLAFHDSRELWRILASTGHAPVRGTSGSERPGRRSLAY